MMGGFKMKEETLKEILDKHKNVLTGAKNPCFLFKMC